MFKSIIFGSLLCVALSGLVVPVHAATKAEVDAATKKSEATKDEKPKSEPTKEPGGSPATNAAEIYRPPSRGAPQARTGGGTRGDARGLSVSVLAPDHTGVSSTTQPDLYWFVSRPVTTPVDFVLMEADAIEPLVEKQLPAPSAAGVQRISLTSLAATLQPGKEYQWSVSLVKDANSRSQDTMAAGKLKVQLLSDDARKKIETGSPDDLYLRYAETGFWYDTISQLRSKIALQPGNQRLMDMQARILEQVGLVDVARFEKGELK
jgi:hypothetical protein